MSKSVSITVFVPTRFYQLLKACADHRNSTPEELTRDALISWVDAELQDNLDAELGLSRGPGEVSYDGQLRALFQGVHHVL